MINVFTITSPVQSNPELESVLRKQASVLTIPARKVILEAETTPRGVYYISSGRTRHYLLGADGMEKVIMVLTAGWFFGETAGFLDVQTHLYVMTEELTELLFIPTTKFRALLRQNPSFNEAIMASFAYKNQLMCREIESQVFYTSRERLLQLLYFSADDTLAVDGNWYFLKHNYTQHELGTILGVSRVTISKFVNEFCKDGIIRVVNRRMQINIRHYDSLGRQLAVR